MFSYSYDSHTGYNVALSLKRKNVLHFFAFTVTIVFLPKNSFTAAIVVKSIGVSGYGGYVIVHGLHVYIASIIYITCIVLFHAAESYIFRPNRGLLIWLYACLLILLRTNLNANGVRL